MDDQKITRALQEVGDAYPSVARRGPSYQEVLRRRRRKLVAASAVAFLSVASVVTLALLYNPTAAQRGDHLPPASDTPSPSTSEPIPTPTAPALQEAEPRAETYPVGSNPYSVAAVPAGVWISPAGYSGIRARLFGADDAGFVQTLELPLRTRVAAYDDDVWFFGGGDGGEPDGHVYLSRNGESPREIVDPAFRSASPYAGVAIPSGLWLVDGSGPEIWFISTDGNVTTYVTEAPNFRDVTVRDGQVWASPGSGTRLVTVSNGVVGYMNLDEIGAECPMGLTTGGGKIWVTDQCAQGIIEVGRAPVRFYASNQKPRDIAYLQGTLWFTTSAAYRIHGLHLETGRTFTVPVGGQPADIVSAHGRLWIANFADGSLTVVRFEEDGASGS